MYFNPLAEHFIIKKAAKKTKLIVPLCRKGDKRGIKKTVYSHSTNPLKKHGLIVPLFRKGEKRGIKKTVKSHSTKHLKNTHLIVPLFRKGEKRGIKKLSTRIQPIL
jgi:hypothetical protein